MSAALAYLAVAIDHLHVLAQFAVITGPERLACRTGVSVRSSVVVEILLGKEALSYGGTAERLGHVGGDAGCLAGFNVHNLEVTPVGGRLDIFDAERVHRRLYRRGEKAKVDHLVAHLLLGDQLVLRVQGELDVVAATALKISSAKTHRSVLERKKFRRYGIARTPINTRLLSMGG